MRAAAKRLIQSAWMKELRKNSLVLALLVLLDFLALFFPSALLLCCSASFFVVCLHLRLNVGLPFFWFAGCGLGFGSRFCLHCPASHARIGSMLGDDYEGRKNRLEPTGLHLLITWLSWTSSFDKSTRSFRRVVLSCLNNKEIAT